MGANDVIPARVEFAYQVSKQRSYHGYLKVAELPRLTEYGTPPVGPAEVTVRFYTDLQGLRTVAGTISCTVKTRCGRCGEPLEVALQAEFCSTPDAAKARSLRLEEKLDLFELEADGSFALHEYLEDFLLMELPLTPFHAADDPACRQPGDSWSFGEIAPQDNPFAALSREPQE